MKNFFYLISFLLFAFLFSHNANAQTWQWAKRAGGVLKGNLPDEVVKGMVVDGKGNSYVLATISTDPAGGDFRIDDIKISNGNGMADICLMSFDCSGKYRWSKIFGGPADDAPSGLKIDSLGGIYVTGAVYTPNFGDTSYFDKDTLMGTPIIGPDRISKSLFIIKYDTAGNYKWVRFPEPDTLSSISRSSYFLSIDVAPNGTLSLLTYLRGTGVFAKGGYIVPTSATIPSLHMMKYDANGNFIKGFPMDISEGEEYSLVFTKMAWDSRNDVYYTHNTIVGSSGITYPRFGIVKMFGTNCLAKFSNTGVNLWVRQSTTTNYANPKAVTPIIDAEGNIYIGTSEWSGGEFNGFVVTNSLGGSNSVPFIVKLNPAGSNIWAYNASATIGGGGRSIAVSEKGDVAFSGNWLDTIKFDSYTAYSPYDDIFLIKLDGKTGILKRFDTLKTIDVSSAQALAADRNGNFFMAGYYASKLIFPGIGSLTKYGGYSDLFIAKFGDADCIPSTINENNIATSAIKVYPNPAHDLIMIEGISIASELSVYNLVGQKLQSKKAGSIKEEIDLSQLANGMYLIQIKDAEGNMFSTKIMKE